MRPNFEVDGGGDNIVKLLTYRQCRDSPPTESSTCQYPAERSLSVVGYVGTAKESVSFECGEYSDYVISQDVNEAVVAEEDFSYAISA